MAPATKKRILSGEFLVPLGVVAAILVPLFTTGIWATWFVRGEVYNYNSTLNTLTVKIENVEKKVNVLAQKDTSWTYAMMRAYSLEAVNKNRNWISPDYRLIKEENSLDN